MNDYQHIVIHRPEKELQLEMEVESLKHQIEKLNKEISELTYKYGYESRLNNELIDLCRENQIKFRPALYSAGNR